MVWMDIVGFIDGELDLAGTSNIGGMVWDRQYSIVKIGVNIEIIMESLHETEGEEVCLFYRIESDYHIRG